MENQHRKISGYRELTAEEIAAMNECKELAANCGQLIDKLNTLSSTDKQALEQGKLNLQQGFMWVIRSIAKPTTFG